MRKKKSLEENVAGTNSHEGILAYFTTSSLSDNLLSDLSRHLISVTINFLKNLFFFSCKSHNIVWHEKKQEIFQLDFPSSHQFGILNSRDILIFEFSWHLIPATFSSNASKNISWLLRHFLPVTFSSYNTNKSSRESSGKSR